MSTYLIVSSHNPGYLCSPVYMFKAQLVITGSQKIPKEKSYEDESHDESLDGGSKGLDTYTSSSEDSGDEADSETNYGEDESGDDGGLEFLVSGKRVEEVHTYMLYMYTI